MENESHSPGEAGAGTGIDLKQAGRIAAETIAQIYPAAKDLLLEEMEKSEDGNYWLITIGFDDEHAPRGGSIAAAIYPPGQFLRTRRYKLVKLNSKTGEVLSMKIRKVD